MFVVIEILLFVCEHFQDLTTALKGALSGSLEALMLGLIKSTAQYDTSELNASMKVRRQLNVSISVTERVSWKVLRLQETKHVRFTGGIFIYSVFEKIQHRSCFTEAQTVESDNRRVSPGGVSVCRDWGQMRRPSSRSSAPEATKNWWRSRRFIKTVRNPDDQ